MPRESRRRSPCAVPAGRAAPPATSRPVARAAAVASNPAAASKAAVLVGHDESSVKTSRGCARGGTPGQMVTNRCHPRGKSKFPSSRAISGDPPDMWRPPSETRGGLCGHQFIRCCWPVNSAAVNVYGYRRSLEAINVKRNRSVAALTVLAAAALAVPACSNSHATLAYAAGAKVDCGGKQTLAASGSTAQANAMTKFIDAYHRECSGQTLNYTANDTGAGISDLLSGKTDFGGSDTPLAGDQYAAAKQRCGGADAWNLPVVFGPLAITYNLGSVASS